MSLTLSTVTFDCADAVELATFWAEALGRRVDDGGSAEFATIAAAPDGGPSLMFARVPEQKRAKNRVHLDLTSTARAADVDRLVGLGAKPLADHDEDGSSWTVMADPAGNEFCVVQNMRG